MKRAIYLSFACAALALGCGSRLETASQERAEVSHSAQRTGRAASRAGEHTGNVASDAAHTVAHGTAGVGHALVTGGREVYQTIGGTRDLPENEARRHRSAQRTREQFGRAGDHAGDAARETPAAVGRTGETIGRGVATGVQGVQHAGGAVRRSTGEQPNAYDEQGRTPSARGGGPTRK